MGMGILGSVMQGAGIAGGIATGMQSGNAQEDVAKDMIRAMKQIHEEGSAERKRVSDMTRADANIARQNLLDSEAARLNVLSSLGQPGTYGPGPGSRSGPLSLGVLKPTGVSGLSLLGASEDIRKTGRVSGQDVALGNKPKWKGEKFWEVEGVKLDPDQMAAQVKDTAGFRTVSRMVAEAEQLMNRTGPLWNQLNNSVVGSIYGSNAAFQRQAMDEVARSVARGGSARRAGLQMVQAFTVQEQINRTRTGQLWQAKMGLEEYRTKYAQDVTGFANQWVNNHAGIRDNFTNALQNLQLYWSQTMAPTLAGATVDAQSATQTGILNASQGLYDAIKTRTAAAQGAFQSLYNLGGSMGGQLTGGSNTLWGQDPNSPGAQGGGGQTAGGSGLAGQFGQIGNWFSGLFGGGGGGAGLAGAGDASSSMMSMAGGMA